MKQLIIHTLISALVLTGLSTSVVLADSMNGQVEYAELYGLSVGTDGIVDGIAASEGQRVLAGTVLLSLATPAFDANINAAQARLTLVQEEQKESKRSFDRDQALYEEGSLSTVELDLARIEMLRQESKLADAKAGLTRANSQKAMGQIVAPVAGLVMKLNVVKGQRIHMAALSEPMVLFAGNTLKVISRVTTAEQGNPGLLDKVQLVAGDVTAAGTVRTISLDDKVKVITISIDALPTSLIHGSTVTVEF